MNELLPVRRDGNYHLTYEGVKHTIMNGGSTLFDGKVISTLAELPTEEEFELHRQITVLKARQLRESVGT